MHLVTIVARSKRYSLIQEYLHMCINVAFNLLNHGADQVDHFFDLTLLLLIVQSLNLDAHRCVNFSFCVEESFFLAIVLCYEVSRV